MSWRDYIHEDLQKLYEIHDYKHAAAILAKEFPDEFREVCEGLKRFRFEETDLIVGGGNESHIPKLFSRIFREMGWEERNLEAELVVFQKHGRGIRIEEKRVEYGSHKVDYVKGRVAFDLEWNSKDQTFDRDLYAFRAFFEYDAISVGIIVTRSKDLNEVFDRLKIKGKYGASTTHIGKLLPRIEAGRSGGCPVLIFGITRELLVS